MNVDYIDPRTIPDVSLTEQQQHIARKLTNITTYLFNSKSLPVRVMGFLLEGSYQTGKTEIIRQSIRTLKTIYADLKYSFNDASTIASPNFGDSEKILATIFTPPSTQHGTFKRIIVLDDIDCLFFGRDAKVSQSWHISLSSVLFHALDDLDPRTTIVMATTNKPDIVDGALRSRLFKILVPEPTSRELMSAAESLIKKLKLTADVSTQLLQHIRSRVGTSIHGYRDIQQAIIEHIVGA